MRTLDHGRASRDLGSAAVRFLWQEADKKNADSRSRACGGEWIPWLAIEVRDDITPRDTHEDADAVERYTQVLDELPPLVVQKDTFVLIGGWNRLAANAQADRQLVRVVELDCTDADLWERAFEDNTIHGLPMTMRERTKAARRYMAAHPDMGAAEIAAWAGINRSTVWRWKNPQQDDQQRAATNAGSAADSKFVALQQTPTEQASPHVVMQHPPAPLPLPQRAAPPMSYGAREPEPRHQVVVVSYEGFISRAPSAVFDEIDPQQRSAQLEEVRKLRRWAEELERLLATSLVTEEDLSGIPF